MMPRFVLRWMAAILVPALLLDPGLAQPLPLSREAFVPTDRCAAQALAVVAKTFGHGKLNSKPTANLDHALSKGNPWDFSRITWILGIVFIGLGVQASLSRYHAPEPFTSKTLQNLTIDGE